MIAALVGWVKTENDNWKPRPEAASRATAGDAAGRRRAPPGVLTPEREEATVPDKHPEFGPLQTHNKTFEYAFIAVCLACIVIVLAITQADALGQPVALFVSMAARSWNPGCHCLTA